MPRTRPVSTLLLAAVLVSLLAACQVSVQPIASPTAIPTPSLPPADEVALAFLQAWERSDYAAMWRLLTPAAQQQYDEDRFADIYRQVADEAVLLSAAPRILAAYQPGARAEVAVATDFSSAVVGDFSVQTQMVLSYVEGRWGVDWTPALIFPQLSDRSSVHLAERVPSRGNIYDRNGLGLAVQGDLVEVGVVPGKIQDETALLAQLSALLLEPAALLQARYAAARPDWYVPLGRLSAESGQANYAALSSMPGVELRRAWTRSYRPELIAPHVVGIVGPIRAEEVDAWHTRGYSGDELVGQLGLERWGEQYLAGQRGGELGILTDQGQQVAVLAARPARESRSIYATFDREFQKTVQDILGNRLGAIAVLEAQTGRVLALATYPTFEPEMFTEGISVEQWQVLQADARRPLVNRATQGTYPPGSSFKIVTTAAALEAGGLTGDSTFVCRGTWTGLGPKWPKTCYQRSGHGRISLARGLTVSCDIVFYEVGLTLNGLGQSVLSDYARQFGLGALTGIEIEENSGLVPDPAWKLRVKGEGWAPGDTVNLSIGQSELLVTPLQMAMIAAAVGNGGTLYRPQVVEMIAADAAHADWRFQPDVLAELPVGQKNLAVMRDALYGVTTQKGGTAYDAFTGSRVPVAGKTGTAESGADAPHAWFVGYAPADVPQIAIAVIVENSGEGAVFAAPLFRQVVEAYFVSEPLPTAEPTP